MAQTPWNNDTIDERQSEKQSLLTIDVVEHGQDENMDTKAHRHDLRQHDVRQIKQHSDMPLGYVLPVSVCVSLGLVP